MWRKRINIWLVASLVGGVFYPLLVYVSLPYAPPFAFVFVGLGLIALRLWGTRHNGTMAIWGTAFLLAAVVLAVLSALSPNFAVKAYPALISGAIASAFAVTLISPPSMIERFARIREPDLSLSGQIYTRRVTQVWTGFLVANCAIATATALWGTVEQWTLWNGLISYLLIGGLFVGEIAVRRFVRRNT